VTGASRGFGYETVRRLDLMGCHVFAGVRTSEAADKIREVCSTRVEPVVIDIAKPDTVRTALEFVTSRLPPGKGKISKTMTACTICVAGGCFRLVRQRSILFGSIWSIVL